MPIEAATDEELAAELARRNEAKRLAAIPKPLANPDFSPLIKMFEDLHKGGRSKDFNHFVMETAGTIIYGPKYWEWRRTASVGDE